MLSAIAVLQLAKNCCDAVGTVYNFYSSSSTVFFTNLNNIETSPGKQMHPKMLSFVNKIVFSLFYLKKEADLVTEFQRLSVAKTVAIRRIYSDANINYDIALILARIDSIKDRCEILMARFFKRQVLASNALLHHLLPEQRDSDTIYSLRNFQPFPSIRACTNKFHKSFLPYCLKTSHSQSLSANFE